MRSYFVSLPWLVIVSMALLSACGTSGSKHGSSRIANVPINLYDGSLVYRNARLQGGRTRRQSQAQPEALVITSVPEENRGLKYDNDIVVSADVVDEEVVRDLRESKRAERSPSLTKGRPNKVSSEQLEAIWTTLRDHGIERFPIHRGDRPPENVPSITVIQGGRQWIFVKYDPSILALGPDDQRDLARAWQQCHLTIVRAFHGS